MFFRSNAEDPDDQPKVEKLSLKKKGIGSEARAERMANADVDLQLLGEAERERQLQKQKRRRRQGHEEDVCHNFRMFLSFFLISFAYPSFFFYHSSKWKYNELCSSLEYLHGR